MPSIRSDETLSLAHVAGSYCHAIRLATKAALGCAQRDVQLEVIVIDDRSTGRTDEILRRLAGQILAETVKRREFP